MTGDTGRPGRHEKDRERRARALKDLEDAATASEVLGTSTFAREARRVGAHFRGDDADPDDRVEVWGRRIGRGLSLIAFFGLLIYLAVTYL